MSKFVFEDKRGNKLQLIRTLPDHGVTISVSQPNGTNSEVRFDVDGLGEVVNALAEMHQGTLKLRAGIEARKSK